MKRISKSALAHKNKKQKIYTIIDILKYGLLLSALSFGLGFYAAKNKKQKIDQVALEMAKRKLNIENEFALMNISIICTEDLNACGRFLKKVKKNYALREMLQPFQKKDVKIVPKNDYGYIFYLDLYKMPLAKIVTLNADDEPELIIANLKILLPKENKNTPE